MVFYYYCCYCEGVVYCESGLFRSSAGLPDSMLIMLLGVKPFATRYSTLDVELDKQISSFSGRFVA